MTKEELFLAIGQVEGSRLLRTEMPVADSSDNLIEEELNMKKRINTGRLVRNLIAAALTVSLLAVTAYAVVGYVIFDSPQEMVTAIFGDRTGYDHKDITYWTDPWKPEEQYTNPAFERVPVDEEVAEEELVPLVSAVGQSISWNGYTLTVDANLYDHVTKCGVLTYTLENPNGLHYALQSNGSLWFPGGELVYFGQYGYSFIIQDKSTDTKLTSTYYYQLRDPKSKDLEITFSQWASITREEIDQRISEIKQQLRQEIPEEEALEFKKAYEGDQWAWFEENRTREENIDAAYEYWAYERLEEIVTCPDKIVIPEQVQGEMTNATLGDGSVVMSAIAMTFDLTKIDTSEYSELKTAKICFEDSSEYVIWEDGVDNSIFAVSGSGESETTIMFNRIIDVDKVASVVINGVELAVD